ncbi:class I SAM-dependent methyltransferase [Spongiivirga citrea]|uniref:Methyltransferase domain-containing protein n=1 Tax=Spongiivirga citrea TaxID=1481457 RepID=A0A6M0CDV0_9FLAO|nr:class I SAM-dependent methyltransferase [Spongiivirga citrea]NER15582.1 methyltransferase domain-containing protein [Spongiivirga citrea]
MKDSIKRFAKKTFFSAPKSMSQNHIQFSQDQLNELRGSIERNYLDRGNTKSTLGKVEYEDAISGQLFERLDYNRNRVAPWLNSVKNLKGLNILEIGCGTGISTLALSEQGANVVGIDVDEGALAVGRDRLRVAGFEPEMHLMNADAIETNFKDRKFDFIIYYAVLEHMTVNERLVSLKAAWDMLPKGSFLSVIETPNRLWYYDSHTAAMPFYDWLPDDLAYAYSKFSPRKVFNDSYSYESLDEANMNKFLRWGRGVSYHEFEVAIAPLNKLNVVSNLMNYEKTTFLKSGFKGLKYIKFLKSLKNGIPSGFCHPYLDIVLQK